MNKIDLVCDVVDKEIEKSLFFGKKFILRLRINAQLKEGYSNIRDYEVDLEDYYKVDVGKTYKFKFIEIEPGIFTLSGSYRYI